MHPHMMELLSATRRDDLLAQARRDSQRVEARRHRSQVGPAKRSTRRSMHIPAGRPAWLRTVFAG
jgi:hypothetical protein